MTDLAAASEGLGAAPRRFLRPLAAFAAAFAAEGDRRILWLPVFFGTGIALYFALTSEPPLWIGGAATLATAAIAVGLRRWPALRNAGIALTFAAAGFAVMQEARLEHGTPMVERRLGPAVITGKISCNRGTDRPGGLSPGSTVAGNGPREGSERQEHPCRIRLGLGSQAGDPGA